MNNWTRCTLSDVCIVDWGNTNLTKKAFVSAGEFLGVSAAGPDGRMDNWEHESHTPVLSAIGAQCGRMFLPQEKFTAIKNTITLTPKTDLVQGKFLFYLLTHIDLPQRGSAQPFISKGDIQKFSISLPPLTEQKRIVEILDEVFEAIEAALDKTIKNVENANSIYTSYLDGMVNSVSATSESVILDELLERITYGFTNPMPTCENGPFKITAKNVNGGRVVWEDTRRTSHEAFESLLTDKSRPLVGDVLLTKDGTLGRVAVVDRPGACINQSVALLRPSDRLLPAFLKLLLESQGFQRRMKEEAGGTTIKHIYISRVKKMSIPCPQKYEQLEIIELIDKFKSVSQRLREVSSSKSQALQALRRSVLQAAFSGQLTNSVDSVARQIAETAS